MIRDRASAGIARRPWAALTVGAPALLAIVEAFHPRIAHVRDADTALWLAVHYAQIVLFPLAALAVAMLVRDREDIAAAICRAAMFVFAISYVAFDTAAGVVTGILVDAAHSSGSPDIWRAPIDAIWMHPIVGGAPSVGAPLLAVAGSVALSIGAVAAAVSRKRAGASWPSVVLLAVSSFAMSVFETHAWPGGPLTFGGIAVAAAWLERQPRRVDGVLDARS